MKLNSPLKSPLGKGETRASALVGAKDPQRNSPRAGLRTGMDASMHEPLRSLFHEQEA